MNPLASLRHRERMIAVVRWLAIAAAVVQVALYPATAASGLGGRALGVAIVAAAALLACAVELLLPRVGDPRRLRRIGALVLVADVAVMSAYVGLYAVDQAAVQWVVLVVLPLEGALRFQLVGALAVWLALVPVVLSGELVGARIMRAPVSLAGIAGRLGLLLVVALLAGYIARDIETQRRLLQRLNDASHHVAAQLEPAEILQTLCREAVWCLDAESAVVYAYDGAAFAPVTAHPAQGLVQVLREDEERHGDQSLVPALLTVPTWLPPNGSHPGRLAVPLRWQAAAVSELLVVRPRAGRPRPFEVDVARSLAESAALALATTRVIAAEQRSNRQLRYLEALRTRFVATVAHDLRMPLTVFKGVSRLLRNRRDGIAPQEVDRMLASVERQANRLSRLADDLLDAARLNADRLRLQPEPCDVPTLIAATIADIDEDVEVEVEPGLRLVADAPRLERVLWNLLSNAEKYGRPPLQVRAFGDGRHVTIAVRDHGPGLDADQRARLFSDFAGSDSATSVGLGLAIVWQLVEAHDGEVAYVDADPGACFEVVLPVAGPRGGGEQEGAG